MDVKKYKRLLVFVLCGGILICSACTIQKTSADKLTDIEFTVVDEEEIPPELLAKVEEGRETPFKLTYGDKGYLYIARGYGRQKTSGYSIEAAEVYVTENAVCMRTNLIGPSKDEEIIKTATYPYIVVKIEYTEKQVVFE